MKGNGGGRPPELLSNEDEIFFSFLDIFPLLCGSSRFIKMKGREGEVTKRGLLLRCFPFYDLTSGHAEKEEGKGERDGTGCRDQ